MLGNRVPVVPFALSFPMHRRQLVLRARRSRLRPLGVAIVGAILPTLGGCLGARQPPSPWNVSSVASDYSPAVELAARATVGADDAVVVQVDSGFVVVPGELRPGSHPVMRGLTLTALVVAPSPDTTGVAHPWEALAESAPVPFADSLRYGEQQRVSALTLVIPSPRDRLPERAWLVFRIDGPAVSEPVRLASGELLAGRLVPGGVRVFACADWNLDRQRDDERARAMKKHYNGAC